MAMHQVSKLCASASCSAVLEVAKQAGKLLLQGRLEIVNLSLPVKMFEPRSYLQKLCDVWVSRPVVDCVMFGYVQSCLNCSKMAT